MVNFLRMLAGIALLPVCWGISRALLDAIAQVAGTVVGVSAPVLALLGGMMAFVVCWMVLPHPVRTYVFAHEMTHALWGILFGARPSKLRVSAQGGSVNLTKTNVFITLAPYFFPFYTFLVTLAAGIAWLVAGRLPWLSLWMFLIGASWAFHVLFTIETLAQRQPDVTLYGRIFSWTFIYSANILLVLGWMAAMTPLSSAEIGWLLHHRIFSAYLWVSRACEVVLVWFLGLFV